MTHDELATLAQDIFGGKVFGSWMIDPEKMNVLERVFVPLQYTSKGKNQLPGDVATIYEYKDKAWPLTVEGYPVFFSMKFLLKEELVTLQAMLNKLAQINTELYSILRNIDDLSPEVDVVG